MTEKSPTISRHEKTGPQRARDRLTEEICHLELQRIREDFSIQQYKYLVDKKKQLLFTDPVTGLMNESGAREEVDALLGDSRPLILIRLNISGFKKVNSNYSHSEGDRVLAQLGELLSISFREDEDKVTSRVHGDEFVIVLQTTTNDIGSILKRLEDLFDRTESKGPKLDDAYLDLGLSHHILVAKSSDDAENYDDLYNSAVNIDEENVGVDSAKRILYGASSSMHNTQSTDSVKIRKSRIHELEDMLADASDSKGQDSLDEDDIKRIYIELLSLYDEALDTDTLTGIGNKHFVETKIK